MEKLYQQDPFLTRFTAQVVSCAADKGGWSVVLDRTAFYPEGGGQPWDTGTLNGIPVTQVQEQDGAVVHTCAACVTPSSKSAEAAVPAFPGAMGRGINTPSACGAEICAPL